MIEKAVNNLARFGSNVAARKELKRYSYERDRLTKAGYPPGSSMPEHEDSSTPQYLGDLQKRFETTAERTRQRKADAWYGGRVLAVRGGITLVAAGVVVDILSGGLKPRTTEIQPPSHSDQSVPTQEFTPPTESPTTEPGSPTTVQVPEITLPGDRTIPEFTFTLPPTIPGN